jgi:hypothetical protein
MQRIFPAFGLVLVLGRIVLGRDHQPPALSRPAIDHFDNVNHFLFVRQRPIDFVVVSGSEIDHDVFVSVKEHGRATAYVVVECLYESILFVCCRVVQSQSQYRLSFCDCKIREQMDVSVFRRVIV